MAMESKDELRIGEEFQDGTGLELSLGLSLSSTDLRQKWKASELASAPSMSSVDPTGESSAATGINGLHSLVKHKPSNKPSGIKTALKKFLDWELDYQEENGTFLDGSNGVGLHKEKDRLLPMVPHDKSSQQIDIAAPDAEIKGNPFLFKELQGWSGRASSRSQSPVLTTPLQLVDALKNTSNSGSPGSTEVVRGLDEDDSIHDDSGQQKRFQDDQKKRKDLMDEQIYKKRVKNEETPRGLELPIPFCEVGSNPMVSTFNMAMENSSQATKGDNSKLQIQHGIYHERQDSAEAEKGYETDGDERPCGEKTLSADLGQNNCKVVSDESKAAGGNFISQLKVLESTHKTVIQTEDKGTWHCSVPMKASTAMMNIFDRENSFKRASAGAPHLQDRPTFVVGRDGNQARTPLQRTRDKVSSETSCVSTGGAEKAEEKSHGGEASSAVPELVSDKTPLSTSIMITSVSSPLPGTSSAQAPYSVSPYPIMPALYPASVSMAHAHGMPFPTGINFPYAVQYVPPGSEGSEQKVPPIGTAAFQQPGVEYPPRLSPYEMGLWMLPSRPLGVSPFANATNGALYNRNTMGVMSEDINVKLPVTRMHDTGMGNFSPGDPSLLAQNQPLFRAAVNSGAHGPITEIPTLSGSSIPPVSQLPSQPVVSDHGDMQSLKDPNGVISFPGFASSVQALQLHPSPGAGRPLSSGGNKDDAGRGGRPTSPAIQQNLQARDMMQHNNLGQGEFSRTLGSEFHQGSTENLSDVLGEDMAFLQYGIAPGLKFGGTGTAPNLPWVHTTGPNGRTIGGVLYRLGRTQLRVVCACHGKHMSPVEFAQHAGLVDAASVDKNVGGNSPLATQAS